MAASGIETGVRSGKETSSARTLLDAARPAQWLKNGFVLAPLLFAAKVSDPALVGRELAAFGAFCLASSGVYLWNDVLDRRIDLKHPSKRNRPIPSGRLGVRAAGGAGAVLVAAGLAAALALNLPTGLFAAGYVAVHVLYSLWLKHAQIVDLMCIAVGFIFRVLAGATAIEVHASHWLLMCTFLLALFLGIAKRRQEIVLLAADSSQHRPVLERYTLQWLDQAGTMLSGATIVAYALYTVSPETQAKFGTDRLIYTLPFVVYGILRYQYLTHATERTGDPTTALLTDRQLLACIASWAAACAAIIYW